MTKIQTLATEITKEALERSFKFAVDFHLDPKKGQSNRTTGQTRGLGGVMDSFLLGKVVESCVIDILKKLNPHKEYELDFEVHDASDADPDIVKIKENSVARKPKVFVEIKNEGEGDRWVGLTEEQFQTMKKNTIVGSDLEKIFIIYATIKNRQSSNMKTDDLLGVFLKSNLKSRLYDCFSNLNDLYVEISLVLTAKELYDKGTRFEKGYYFYETEIFQECDPKLRDRKGIEKVKSQDGILPRFQYNKSLPYPDRFGDILYKGEIVMYKKENEKSNRMYAYCVTDVEVSNKIIGNFKLKKDHLYEYMPSTVGRNPVLNRNNIWIAKRNVQNVVCKTMFERMKEIADLI